MRKYKLFLASSGELELERKELALMITRLNNAWVDKDVYLELVLWEDLLHSFRGGERIQDYFNREMLKCEVVIVVFYKKVGQFTREEFNTAYRSLLKKENPRHMFVYFKDGMVSTTDIAAGIDDFIKISQLRKEIEKYEQIYRTFNSIEDLQLKLQRQLELSIVHKEGKGEDDSSNDDIAQYYLESYKEHIRQNFQYLDFTGLNAILQKPLKLEQVYVKLRAKETIQSNYFSNKISRLKADPIGLWTIKHQSRDNQLEVVEELEPIFERLFDKKKAEKASFKVLILGNPGSGKTTLMKWIALQCLNKGNSVFSSFVPVFISLKDLGSDPDGTFRKKGIGDVMIALAKRENCEIESFYQQQFKENRLLFLLDGLDEIGDEKIRREAIIWIQTQNIGRNPLIVTSRFSGINPAEGLRFRDDIPVFEIQDFEIEDIELFLKNWYRNVEVAVAGLDHEEKGVIDTAEKKSAELIKVIKDKKYKNLRELAVNPLLLTIIAIVHRTRAVLPRDRHKLYEECLKVMIELWNLSNRKLEVSFSFDNSMAHLSKIAAELMKNERREMKKEKIIKCLPETIEGESREIFLKEMVLKAGLLFESEGKYGFLHLTFQEFLAAWHFANSKNQNDILQYRDKDYWQETFKLFVNTGNAERLFDEIIDNIETKQYWKEMELWNQCLREIVVEEVKNTIGINFAKKAITILAGLEYKKGNTGIVEHLLSLEPLLEQSHRFTMEGWELLENAPHPLVQSFGISVVARGDEANREKLIKKLKQRLHDFENNITKTKSDYLEYQLANNNLFPVLLYRRRKLDDFYFILTRLNSSDEYIQYNIIVNLLNLLALRDLLNLLKLRDLLDLREPLAPRDLLDLLGLRVFLDLRVLLFVGYGKATQEKVDRFFKDYKKIFEEKQATIAEWSDRAVGTLHGLSDEELLKYFPNTTEEELKEFRGKDHIKFSIEQ